MTCNISRKAIEETIAFHGHSCPGLSIGIRVAEYVKQEFPQTASSDLICVTETDMCGVDGIQFLTGCTYGKGNLIHRDYGKSVFSFYDRSVSRGIRLVLKAEVRGAEHGELADLMSRSRAGQLSPSEGERLTVLRSLIQEGLMSLPLEEMFSIEELEFRPPRSARVLQSLVCESCAEQTMESRTRRYAGKTLCIPCYEKVEQKI